MAFRYSLFLFPKCLLASRLALCRLSKLLCFGSYNHCILPIPVSSNCDHYSSNHGLCCFHPFRPSVSLAEILLFSLMFSKTLFMSLLSFNNKLYIRVQNNVRNHQLLYNGKNHNCNWLTYWDLCAEGVIMFHTSALLPPVMWYYLLWHVNPLVWVIPRFPRLWHNLV